MAKIAKSLTELIGNTPLLELSNFNKAKSLDAKVVAKLEYFNPLGSVKDRIGYAMIKDAEDRGVLNKDSVIIELKSVEGITPVHEAQVLTYLKFAEKKIGLLINFNVLRLKDGLKRFIK